MVWDNIANELDQDAKKRNKFDFWKWILIPLFLLIGVGGFYFIKNQKEVQHPAVQIEETIQENEKENIQQPNKKDSSNQKIDSSIQFKETENNTIDTTSAIDYNQFNDEETIDTPLVDDVSFADSNSDVESLDWLQDYPEAPIFGGESSIIPEETTELAINDFETIDNFGNSLFEIPLLNPDIDFPKFEELIIEDSLETDKDSIKNKRWSLFAYISPIMMMNNTNWTKETQNYDYNSPIILSPGLEIRYQINKWSISTGIEYIKLKQEYDSAYLNNKSDITTSSDIDYTNAYTIAETPPKSGKEGEGTGNTNATKASITENISYINIPLSISRQLFQKNRFTLNAQAGINTYILQQNEINSESTLFTGKLGEFKDLKTVSIAPNIGLDLQYQFNQKFSVGIQPFMNYLPSTIQTSTDAKPWLFGVKTGLIYRF